MSTTIKERTTGRQARPSLLPKSSDPTWDPAAEQAVLGGILLIPHLLGQVRKMLAPDDFFLPAHQVIFAALLSLEDEGSAIDQIILAARVAGDPEVEASAGKSYIWILPELAVPALHAPEHARIVKDLSRRRKAGNICLAVLENQLDPGEASVALGELETGGPAIALPTVDAITFCRETPEEPDWIWEGYLARGAITELDAKIKTGKSHLAADLIGSVLGGKEFLDRRTIRVPVLYLTEERSTSFRALLRRVGLEETPDLHLTFRHQAKGGWPEIGRAVIARAKSLGIGLVVVDTLSVWSGIEADKENDAGAAMEAMRPLEAMAAAGLAVLVLRHERKSGGEVGESARGSSAFGGAADILLSLQKDPAPGHENRRVLGAVGRLEGWAPKLVLEMTGGHYRSLGTSAQVEAERARAFLLEVLPPSEENALPEKEILGQAEQEMTRSTLRRVLGDLVSAGVVMRAKGAGSASSRAYGFFLAEGGDR